MYSARTVEPSGASQRNRWRSIAAGHAAPHDRIGQSGAPEELRHLRDVPEHVGQVADPHRPAELRGACPATLEVSYQGLAADEELVHEDLPRADGEPAAHHVAAQALLLLGTNLEVVVDRRELAVERERELGLRLEHLHDPVDEVDELHPEALERPIPLAVPVRMGDEMDRLPPVGRHCSEPTRYGAPCAYDE